MEPDFKKFADEIIQLCCWDAIMIDGADVQEIAVKCGVMKEVRREEPCGEFCTCAEITDFPTICYEKTYKTT